MSTEQTASGSICRVGRNIFVTIKHMNQKLIIGIVVALAVVVAALALRGERPPVEDTTGSAMKAGETAPIADAVKEFSMTSYYDADGKWFSLKEISVKKGDRVRIKVTNTKGTHDFAIDEYGIKEMTPLDKETVIEFTADKAGEFTYYCSMPGHRQGGQFGTLIVKE